MKHVYCIEAVDENYRAVAYKIGVAGNLRDRIAQMQTSNHALLRLVTSFACHADARMEGCLHDWLQAFRIRGEWFRPEPCVLSAMLRCAAVFRQLTDEQNVVLCGALVVDGWLYRQVKGVSDEPLPAWLRMSA